MTVCMYRDIHTLQPYISEMVLDGQQLNALKTW